MGQTRLCVVLHSKACSLLPKERSCPKEVDDGAVGTAHEMLSSETAACWGDLFVGRSIRPPFSLILQPLTFNGKQSHRENCFLSIQGPLLSMVENFKNKLYSSKIKQPSELTSFRILARRCMRGSLVGSFARVPR